MSNFITAHFDALVTVGVTILGFVINYFVTKRNFQEEIKKEKIGKTTEVIQSLPYKICTMMNSVLHGYKIEDNQYEEIMFKTLSYGSRDAVNIAIKAQHMVRSVSKLSEGDRFLVLTAYALLITQLKYDLSSEIISPCIR